jgi:hypothetical protein
MQTTWQNATINLQTSQIAGQTRTLVFMFRCETGAGQQPPIALDFIRLSYNLATGPPSNVTLSIPLNEATFVPVYTSLAWTPNDGGIADEYKVYLDTSPTFPTEPTIISSSFRYFTPPVPLLPDMTYYWKVVPVNESGEPANPQVRSFTTATTLFYDNFATTDINWTIVNGAAVNRWVRGTLPHGILPAPSTPNAMYITNQPNATPPPWIYTITSFSRVFAYHDVTFPENVINPKLAIRWLCQGESANFDYFTVMLKPTTYIPTAQTQGIGQYQADPDEIGKFNLQSNWVTQSIDIPPSFEVAGTTQRLVIMWHCNQTGGTQPPAAIDYIAIVCNLALPTPSAVSLTTPQNNGSFININPTLRWLPNDGGEIDHYHIFLDTDINFTETTPIILTSEFTNYRPNAPLLLNTTYYWKVVPSNVVYGMSVDTPQVWSFTTGMINSFPHSENFDDVTVPNLPAGWYQLLSPNMPNAFVRTSTTNPFSTPNCVEFFNGNNNGNIILVTPPLRDLNTLRVKFRITTNNLNNPTLDVGYVVDSSDPQSFIPIRTVTATNSWSAEHIVSFIDAELPFEADYSLAFRHGQGGISQTIRLDNITIEQIPDGVSFHCIVTSLDFGLINQGSSGSANITVASVGSTPLIIHYDGNLPPAITSTPPAPINISNAQTIVFTLNTEDPHD